MAEAASFKESLVPNGTMNRRAGIRPLQYSKIAYPYKKDHRSVNSGFSHFVRLSKKPNRYTTRKTKHACRVSAILSSFRRNFGPPLYVCVRCDASLFASL
mmetsp:Transcript_4098/g.8868  ORF Transcript_4098/g.8868 Transcript_4098/m.8868 type:complete len:100 (-) Transcript_4098:154-453(-)